MVRAVISLLLCTQALGDSALMQTQSQSDHILDALHTGSGRVKKMQENTQAMEDQYRALLQNIVSSGSLQDPKTGTPWLPGDDFFKVVDEQFVALIDELKEEKEANSKLLTDAHAAVDSCNTAMEKAFDDTILGELSTMQANRGTHKTCREAENGEIDTMEAKCAIFDNFATKCSEEQDWYAAYEDSSIANVAGQQNTLKSVIDSAEVCKNKVTDVEGKSQECDNAQSTFKSSYCAYEKSLDTTCTTHNTCYVRETGNLAATTNSVKDLEKEQKTIYKMVKKVQCYIEKLRSAAVDSMPTQDDITYCTQQDPDTSILSITYTDPSPESACLTNSKIGSDKRDLASSTNKPGEASWYSAEMDGLTTHDTLNSNCACGKSCTGA